MEMIEKTVKVAKETSEIADAVANVFIATKTACKDGFQAGQDIPVIVTSAITELPKAIEGAEKIGAEFKENKGAFLMAWMLAGEKVFESFQS